MRFKDLAWGSFIYANVTQRDPTYRKLVSDKGFLRRLCQKPSLDDFQTLRQFLVQYGVRHAPKTLAQQYVSMWPQLEDHVKRLINETLETCELNSNEIKKEIELAYSILHGPNVWGGDTVASKVLHFFNVSLFVMWDNDIKVEHLKFGPGYVEFLQIMQQHLVEAQNDFKYLSLPGTPAEFLSQQLGYSYAKPLTKFLDDYNWVTITRRWPSTAPDWLLTLFA